jgi:hypothetical protein
MLSRVRKRGFGLKILSRVKKRRQMKMKTKNVLALPMERFIRA